MDEDLLRILTANTGSAGMPGAVSAIEQMMAGRRQQEQAQEQARVERANAIMGQIEEQRMMEQMLHPTEGAGQRALGPGALRDRRTLAGGPPGGEMIPYEGMNDVMAMPPVFDEAAFDRDYAAAERNGTNRPPRQSVTYENGRPVIEISGPRYTGASAFEPPTQPPMRLESRGIPGHRAEAPPRYAGSYDGPRSPGGMEAASKMRQETLKQRLGQERDVTKSEYKAREAELASATRLTAEQIRANNALARTRAKGAPKGTDPFKWAKESLDNAQRNADQAMANFAKLQNGGLASDAQVRLAEQAMNDANEERDAARASYDELASRSGGPRVGGTRSGPKPTGNTKTDKNGVVWEEMSDGSARKRGA